MTEPALDLVSVEPAAVETCELGVAPVELIDAESLGWLAALRSADAGRDAAIRELHTLLLRAARFQVYRRRNLLPGSDSEELDGLAQHAADDATVAVLRRLDSYEGRSRFTTWAYKFAIMQAAVVVRRAAWQHREIPLEPADWPFASDRDSRPDELVEHREFAQALRHAIETALTPHQRTVLVALAVNQVPVDVLAERLGATRGAVYKTLHDARARLRQVLAGAGLMQGIVENSHD